ncbi:lipid-A-disaccharide synthase [Nitrincola sp. MINF-07-Sa-05]|uniref:lipid-A-disaccharide synthase n=1 Tax=Nitrincola salilacus TaxID=3400273 RepID=UPI0039184B04
MTRVLKVAIVAGEASGDILGAGLIQALRQQYPQMQVEGIGGELMQAQGCESLFPMERLSVMGLVEVLGRLRELLGIRRQLVKRWMQQPPDLFIGIDAPDFNLGLEQSMHEAGVTTVHYVSPSVWAWRKKRVHKIKRNTDLMLTLFPFEAAFYQAHQQRVAFVGHPLADQIPLQPDQHAARASLGLDHDAQVIALLPGSRAGEVTQLAAPFLDAARILTQKRPGLVFVLPAASQSRYDELQRIIQNQYQDLEIHLVLKNSHQALCACDAVLIASGTATLEAMLCKRPMVVAYRMSPITFRILSYLVSITSVSLPNLLAGRQLVPEVLQNEVTPQRLADEIESLLDDQIGRQALLAEFTQLHQSLRLDADVQAARAISELLIDKGTL